MDEQPQENLSSQTVKGNHYTPPETGEIGIGAKFFRYRDYTPLPLILMFLLFEKVSVLSAVLGILTIGFGELIRIYSVAFIGSISRTRKNRTGGRLIQEGPFSYVRNPLYVGNFLITTGIAIFTGNFFLIILAAVLFAVQYYYIVKYEEDLLLKTFGDEYVQYANNVPPWIPDRRVVLDEIAWPDTFAPAIRSESKTLMAIFAMVGLLTLLGS